MIAISLQVLLTFVVEGEGPVRFGFPLPAAALARGLAVEGAAALALQWRPLHPAPARDGHWWCELAIDGAGMRGPQRKSLRLRGGGVPPTSGDGGAVYARHATTVQEGALRVTTTVWQFAGGEVDRRVRTEVLDAEQLLEDEALQPGEAFTDDSQHLAARTQRVAIAPREWARAGVIPLPTARAAPWREHVVAIGKQMPCLPGRRGAGDYARAGGVVTNLEFDTTLGFVQLGLACRDPVLLARALQSARHLVDHDLDRQSGLPFPHGIDHRSSPPEPGHVWLQGLLLVGHVFADDDLIAAAGSLAHGLARQPRRPPRVPAHDRARDVGWPLLELETYLAVRDEPSLRRAADALAHEVIARYDARAKVVRFGEGERRDGAYEERAWLTGGILLPALRRYAARTGDARAWAIVRAGEERLLHLLRRGQQGIPVRYYVDRDGLGSELRLTGTGEAFLVLEGLAPAELPRVLARAQVAACLEGVPRADDPDVATQFSLAARCTWLLR